MSYSDPRDLATRDLGLGAFLIASGFPLLRIVPDRVHSQQSVFVFSAAAREAKSRYYDGALIDAHKLVDCFCDLRRRHNESRRTGR